MGRHGEGRVMFGFSYRYIEGADGRHYCFTNEPVFACDANALLDDDERMEKMAAELGVRVGWLKGKLRHMSERARDDKNRLINRCVNCGSTLTRRGFRCWIEAPGDEHEATTRINRRLGGDGFKMVEGPWFQPSRKAAKEWAQSRVRQLREAA
jgi:hypothetical protein